MCWNASVSMNTYLFSVFASSIALLNGVITLPYFLFVQSFIIMQLIEWGLWSYPKYNRILSMLAYTAILLQPLFSLNTIPNKHKYLRTMLMLCYVAFLILLNTVLIPWKKINFSSVKASNGHLSWKWLQPSMIILIIWMVFFLAELVITKKWLRLLMNIALFVFIYYNNRNTLTWGSLWCWIANVLSVILLIQVFQKDLCVK